MISTGGTTTLGLYDLKNKTEYVIDGNQTQKEINLYGGKKYDMPIGGYPEGANLLLDDNVTEVVSTIAGNQNNPNTDMTGWILKPNRTTAANVADASGETQQQVNYNGGSKWHSRVGGYLKNERVVLDNGDIVKSTVDSNANDPNVDMTGWQFDDNTVESIADLTAITNPKDGKVVYVKELDSNFVYSNAEWKPTRSNISIHLEDFPRIIGEIDDTGRFLRASDAIKLAVIPSSPSYYLVASSQELIIPYGYYSISDEIVFNGLVKIKSDGQAIIQQTNSAKSIFLFNQTTNDYNRFSSYRNIVSGIKFVGGKHAIYFSNGNIDATSFEAVNCEFHSTSDYAIAMHGTWKPSDDHLSALVTIEKCKFIKTNGFVYSKADKCTLKSCWLYVDKVNFSDDRATIVNQAGTLILDDCLGVPVVGEGNPDTTDRLKNVRWVDNYGSFHALNTRFGLEEQGMPIVYSFGGEWQDDRMTSFNMAGIAPNNATQMGSSIIIENCYASGGTGYKIADSGVVVLRKYLPQQIIIRGNNHILSCPLISVHPDYVDFPTYLSTLYGNNRAKLLDKYNYQLEFNQIWEADKFPSAYPADLAILVNRGRINENLSVPKLISKSVAVSNLDKSVFRFALPINARALSYLVSIVGNTAHEGSPDYRDTVTYILTMRTQYNSSKSQVSTYLTAQKVGDYTKPEGITQTDISATFALDSTGRTEVRFDLKKELYINISNISEIPVSSGGVHQADVQIVPLSIS